MSPSNASDLGHHQPADDEVVAYTIKLPRSIVEKTKDMVFWTPGLRVGRLVAELLAAEIDRREQERGEDFPPRSSGIRGGIY